MNQKNNMPNAQIDARPLSTEELLSALHAKFSSNFSDSKPSQSLASEAERRARALSEASRHLELIAADSPHQSHLAKCLDEVFGDIICAIYLGCCGMQVPARMLLRRSLELGLVVAAYWDSPVEFWNWREHDENVSFSELCAHLQSNGYKTLCAKQVPQSTVDPSEVLRSLGELYGKLSNVVHPKPYNFSTSDVSAYSFRPEDIRITCDYAIKVQLAISIILSARFSGLKPILL